MHTGPRTAALAREVGWDTITNTPKRQPTHQGGPGVGSPPPRGLGRQMHPLLWATALEGEAVGGTPTWDRNTPPPAMKFQVPLTPPKLL